jgi:hypothetical protein
MTNQLNNDLAVEESQELEGGLNTEIDNQNRMIEETSISVSDILGFSDSKMIQDILKLDVTENPNSRSAVVYKYMRRLIKPLIKESVFDIYR